MAGFWLYSICYSKNIEGDLMDFLPTIISGAADISTIGICLWLLRIDRRVLRLEILQEKENGHV